MFQQLESRRTSSGVSVDVYRFGGTLVYIPAVPGWRSSRARRVQWLTHFERARETTLDD